MNNALLDKDFIKKLTLQKNSVIYADITLLNQDEEVIQSLNGLVTTGNININGQSSNRRSCNLTMTIKADSEFCREYWVLDSKFRLQIGLQNTINSDYDSIIWFPEGTYIITSFSLSASLSGLSISIQGKDKMGKLDGTLGGKFTASSNFSEMQIVDTNSTYTKKIPIKEIITELVHNYGGEPYGNILLNDIPDYGLELETYYGNSPIYFLQPCTLKEDNTVEVNKEIFNAFTDNGDFTFPISIYESTGYIKKSLQLDDDQIIYYNRNKDHPSLLNGTSQQYCILKFEYGDTIGYKQTDLTYAGNLTANIGETATAVLDKIKTQLGEYEYFYDVYGNFIFQKKKNYLQGTYDLFTTDDRGKIKYNMDSYYAFEFDNSVLTNVSRNTTVNNVKNDYTVVGTATNSKQNTISCRARIAIDHKPIKYNSIEVTEEEINKLRTTYGAESYPLGNEYYIQTPVTYLATTGTPSAGEGEIDPTTILEEVPTYLTEITYNVDWREIIYQMARDYYNYHRLDDFLEKVAKQNSQYNTGVTGYEQYYTDIYSYWRQLYDYSYVNNYNEDLDIDYDSNGWNAIVRSNPTTMPFWFDFIDTTNSVDQYSVPVIGDRVFTKSDKSVKSVYYPETPNIIFYQSGETIDPSFGTDYSKYLYDSRYATWFSISYQGISALESIYSSINSNLLINETVTLQSKPLYFLEPNTRVHIQSNEIGISGDYVISSISIPLSIGAVSSIQATKINPDLITV